MRVRDFFRIFAVRSGKAQVYTYSVTILRFLVKAAAVRENGGGFSRLA